MSSDPRRRVSVKRERARAAERATAAPCMQMSRDAAGRVLCKATPYNDWQQRAVDPATFGRDVLGLHETLSAAALLGLGPPARLARRRATHARLSACLAYAAAEPAPWGDLAARRACTLRVLTEKRLELKIGPEPAGNLRLFALTPGRRLFLFGAQGRRAKFCLCVCQSVPDV